MAKDFMNHLDQYNINRKFLKQFDDSLTGLSLLEKEIRLLKQAVKNS